MDDLKANLALQAARLGYKALSRMYGVNKGLLWQIVNRGHEPKNAAIRQALGLPPEVAVEPVAGAKVRPGALIVKSEKECACGCGRWFVPGHPRQIYLPGHRKHRKPTY